MANPSSVPEPASPALQPLVDEQGKRLLRTVVRAVSEGKEKLELAKRFVPLEVLRAAAGIVAFGGNAVEDERALYDG